MLIECECACEVDAGDAETAVLTIVASARPTQQRQDLLQQRMLTSFAAQSGNAEDIWRRGVPTQSVSGRPALFAVISASAHEHEQICMSARSSPANPHERAYPLLYILGQYRISGD